MSAFVYAELVPLGGGDAIPLAQDYRTVGRKRSNDICLDYPNVSSCHCEFTCEEGLWFVKDLGSSNGVKVNGEKIATRKVLKPGDTVIIAKAHQYTIEYKLDKTAKARLEEIAGQEEDIFAMSLMEKAGLERQRGRLTEDSMTLPFAGQVAFVTGASSGIGRASAEMLAAAAQDVALNYFSMDEAAEAAAEKIRRLGRNALLYRVDISKQDAVETMVADIVKQLGRLDVFVSSAVYSDREPFHTADMAGFRKTIDVSMWGPYYCLRAWANQVLKQKSRGSAVIVSSPHGQIGFPNCMAYNMAKAANDQMMRSAARELMPHRVRVNAIYPGWTDTPGERKFISEQDLADQAKKQPWGRLASPEEIARGVLFLADPASDFITGTILHLDGGLFLPWWSQRGTGDF